MSNQSYKVSLRIKIIREVIRTIIRFAYRILVKVRITGKENIPDNRSFVIAYNHVSYFDPPLLMCFWQPAPEAIGAEYLFTHPVFKFLAHGYGAIPVNRGQYDRKVIQTCINILNSDLTLLIAPEGTRSKSPGMNQANSGISYIVDKTDVQVLPIGCIGTTSDMLKQALRFKRPLVEINIGKPFELPKLEGRGQQRRDARLRNADYVMVKIAELLPKEYHGYYSDKKPEDFLPSNKD